VPTGGGCCRIDRAKFKIFILNGPWLLPPAGFHRSRRLAAMVARCWRLLPPGGSARRPRRVPVIVRFGAPVSLPELAGTGGDAMTDATAQARAQVAALVAD
jgi:hypothetical protein